MFQYKESVLSPQWVILNWFVYWNRIPGGRLNIKMSSYQYRDPMSSLTWESPYLGKTVFILRRIPGLLQYTNVLYYIFFRSTYILLVTSFTHKYLVHDWLHISQKYQLCYTTKQIKTWNRCIINGHRSHWTHVWCICMYITCVNKTKATLWVHDDVIKWKHFPRYWPFVRGIHRSPVNSPHKGQWRGALMFSLICV